MAKHYAEFNSTLDHVYLAHWTNMVTALCRRLYDKYDSKGRSTYEVVLRLAKDGDNLYDGIALEACRAILSGELLRMGLNALYERRSGKASLRYYSGTHFPIGDEAAFRSDARGMYEYLMGPPLMHTADSDHDPPFYNCTDVGGAVDAAAGAAFVGSSGRTSHGDGAVGGDTERRRMGAVAADGEKREGKKKGRDGGGGGGVASEQREVSSHVTSGFMSAEKRAHYRELLQSDKAIGPYLHFVLSNIEALKP